MTLCLFVCAVCQGFCALLSVQIAGIIRTDSRPRENCMSWHAIFSAPYGLYYLLPAIAIALISFPTPFSFPPKDEINYFNQCSENHYSSFALSFAAQTCAAKCGRLGISPIYFFLASFLNNSSGSCSAAAADHTCPCCFETDVQWNARSCVTERISNCEIFICCR